MVDLFSSRSDSSRHVHRVSSTASALLPEQSGNSSHPPQQSPDSSPASSINSFKNAMQQNPCVAATIPLRNLRHFRS